MVLTQTDLSLNLGCLKFLSKIFLIPMELHGNAEVVRAFQRHKLYIWLAVMGLAQLIVMKAAVSLLMKLLWGQGIPLGSLSLYFFISVPCECTLVAGLWAFLMWPEVTAAIFRNSLHVSKSYDEESRAEQQSGFAMRHTLQELLIIFFPFFWYPAGVIVLTAKIVFDTWPESEGWPILFRVFIVALDTLGIFTCVTCIYCTVLSHILFMATLVHTLESQKEILR